jgi:hypothetical protein
MDNLYAKVADDHIDPLSRLRDLFVLTLQAASSNGQDHEY